MLSRAGRTVRQDAKTRINILSVPRICELQKLCDNTQGLRKKYRKIHEDHLTIYSIYINI